MTTALVGVGSNLDDRVASCDRALALLAECPDIRMLAISSLHESTAAVGSEQQNDFLNAAVLLETSLDPHSLLHELLDIERRLGRRRQRRWSARSIDLDLLLYDDFHLDCETLTLPHPRMAFRRFVLVPALEIAPDMIHPTTGWTIRRLLEHLDTAENYLALTGTCCGEISALAERLAARKTALRIGDPIGDAFWSPRDDDATGHAMQTWIEFLDRRAKPLQLRQGHPAGQWLISDYWFDECRVLASMWFRDERLQRCEQLWQQVRPGVLTPKLLIEIEMPPTTDIEASAESPADRRLEDDWRKRLRDELRHRIEAHQGPVFRLRAGDVDWAVTEVTAAIQAMR